MSRCLTQQPALMYARVCSSLRTVSVYNGQEEHSMRLLVRRVQPSLQRIACGPLHLYVRGVHDADAVAELSRPVLTINPLLLLILAPASDSICCHRSTTDSEG